MPVIDLNPPMPGGYSFGIGPMPGLAAPGDPSGWSFNADGSPNTVPFPQTEPRRRVNDARAAATVAMFLLMRSGGRKAGGTLFPTSPSDPG